MLKQDCARNFKIKGHKTISIIRGIINIIRISIPALSGFRLAPVKISQPSRDTILNRKNRR